MSLDSLQSEQFDDEFRLDVWREYIIAYIRRCSLARVQKGRGLQGSVS